MAPIDAHRLPARIRNLDERLRQLLKQLPEEHRRKLEYNGWSDNHERLSLAFTGLYSSGKSTLIRALTDEEADVVIDAAVATSRVETFRWDGVVDLVDTPGVRAGITDHDDKAERAIREADLVVFTMSVDLLDDSSAQHLRHIIEDLQKAPQLLVVISKANTMAADAGVRDGFARDALGAYAGQVPWVECDARDYLKALHEPDPARAARLRRKSNLDGLTDTINHLARERGQLARFRTPVQEILLVASDARALLADDSNVQAVLTVLSRHRRALTQRRDRMETVAERLLNDVRAAALRHAEAFVDEIELLEASQSPQWDKDLKVATKELNTSIENDLEEFSHAALQLFTRQFEDLAVEIREIEASPSWQRTKLLETQGPSALFDSSAIQLDIDVTGPSPKGSSGMPDWFDDIPEKLRRFQELWGAGGGVKNSAGTAGHKFIYSMGKKLKYNFKPYEAVRWANRVGKAAKYGTISLPIALDTLSTIREERQEVREATVRRQRRSRVVSNVLAQVDDILSGAMTTVRTVITEHLGPDLEEIDRIYDGVCSARDDRSDLSIQLQEVIGECHELLDAIGTKALPAD